MAYHHETTFGAVEADERFKKLERSLKLALLKKNHNQDARDVKASPVKVTTWPSISSINVDSVNSNCTALSHTSPIRSDVLASSNNLRNILLKKKSHNIKPAAMTTSSVNQYHVQQDTPDIDRHIMPPPLGSTVYRSTREPHGRVHTSSNCEKAALPSFNSTVQSSTVDTFSLTSAPSWMSAYTHSNLNTFVTPATSVNTYYKIDRVFTKWKIMLNDQYELLIKGTLNCGRVARSKPVIRRYSAICVESKFKHKYILQGNIADEKNALPDYIRGKFYNGFPDDWENVYQIWRTYVSRGCPVMFRWPTRITDSDDDLKTELTDLTYTCSRNKKATSVTGSCNLNEYPKTKDLTYKSNTFEKKEKSHNHLTDNSQNYEKNTSFVKSFISNSEKDIIPVVQTRHVKSLCNDENKQNVKLNVNPSYNSKKIKNILKDILQEDKVNIIINNLTDKNCSPKYIEKIFEMFDCLDYVVSYKTESECNNDSVVSINEISKSETIPMQQNLVRSNSSTNINKLENKPMEPRSEIRRNNVDTYGHSTDLGYGSLRIDSNTIQLLNPVNTNKPENDENSDLSESETYAGVPKISFERVLKARGTPRKICRRKIRKKPDDEKRATNLSHSPEKAKSESCHVTNPIAQKNLFDSEFCVSITEDEVETTSNTRECRQTTDTHRPQEMIFSNHRQAQRSNFDVYGEGKSVTQNKQPSDSFDNQKVNLNVFIKEQKIPHRNQKETYSSFVADVDYTMNSDSDVITFSSNTRRTGGSTITSHVKDQDVVISSGSNSNLLKKSSASPRLYKEFIKQTKNDTAIKKTKPTIISSMPVNLNLRISTDNIQEDREKLHDATMNSLNTRVSSRGRHIVPPLYYWAGERITLKDNTVIYSQGSLQASSVLSLTDNSKEIQKNTMDTREKKEQKVNSKKQSVNKQILLPESDKTSNTNQTIVIENSQTSKKSPKMKNSTNNAKRFDKKLRKSNKRAKKFSSTESNEEEQETSPRKRVRNSKTNKNADPETRYTMELRKRQKIETTSNKMLRKNTTKSKAFRSRTICQPFSSIKESENHEITYTFHKNVQQSEDFLSETEISFV